MTTARLSELATLASNLSRETRYCHLIAKLARYNQNTKLRSSPRERQDKRFVNSLYVRLLHRQTRWTGHSHLWTWNLPNTTKTYAIQSRLGGGPKSLSHCPAPSRVFVRNTVSQIWSLLIARSILDTAIPISSTRIAAMRSHSRRGNQLLVCQNWIPR